MSRDHFNLDGRVALVAGASRGIGEAIARRLAEYGAHVLVTSRRIEGCTAVAESIRAAGGKSLFYPPGSTVTFVSTLVNDTLDPTQKATNVVIQGSLPSGLNLLNCASREGVPVNCRQDIVEVTYSDLPAGESREITINATVAAGLSDGTVLNHRASAYSDEVTADLGATTATSSIAVTAPRTATPEAVSGTPTNPPRRRVSPQSRRRVGGRQPTWTSRVRPSLATRLAGRT